VKVRDAIKLVDLDGWKLARMLGSHRQLIREAIEFHLEGMRLHGEAIPTPTTHVEQIEVPA